MTKHLTCNIMALISVFSYAYYGSVEYQAYVVAFLIAGMICGAIESK